MTNKNTIDLPPAPPGSRVVIHNHTDVSRHYRIQCGDYGSFEITLLIGGTLEFTTGTIPPSITFVEKNIKPGIRPFNHRAD